MKQQANRKKMERIRIRIKEERGKEGWKGKRDDIKGRKVKKKTRKKTGN